MDKKYAYKMQDFEQCVADAQAFKDEHLKGGEWIYIYCGTPEDFIIKYCVSRSSKITYQDGLKDNHRHAKSFIKQFPKENGNLGFMCVTEEHPLKIVGQKLPQFGIKPDDLLRKRNKH